MFVVFVVEGVGAVLEVETDVIAEGVDETDGFDGVVVDFVVEGVFDVDVVVQVEVDAVDECVVIEDGRWF